jgi:hypothetical protein
LTKARRFACDFERVASELRAANSSFPNFFLPNCSFPNSLRRALFEGGHFAARTRSGNNACAVRGEQTAALQGASNLVFGTFIGNALGLAQFFYIGSLSRLSHLSFDAATFLIHFCSLLLITTIVHAISHNDHG